MFKVLSMLNLKMQLRGEPNESKDDELVAEVQGFDKVFHYVCQIKKVKIYAPHFIMSFIFFFKC